MSTMFLGYKVIGMKIIKGNKFRNHYEVALKLYDLTEKKASIVVIDTVSENNKYLGDTVRACKATVVPLDNTMDMPEWKFTDESTTLALEMAGIYPCKLYNKIGAINRVHIFNIKNTYVQGAIIVKMYNGAEETIYVYDDISTVNLKELKGRTIEEAKNYIKLDNRIAV